MCSAVSQAATADGAHSAGRPRAGGAETADGPLSLHDADTGHTSVQNRRSHLLLLVPVLPEHLPYPLKGGGFLHGSLQFRLDLLVAHPHFHQLFLLLLERFLYVIAVFPLLHQLFHLGDRMDVVLEIVDDLHQFLLYFIFYDVGLFLVLVVFWHGFQVFSRGHRLLVLECGTFEGFFGFFFWYVYWNKFRMNQT